MGNVIAGFMTILIGANLAGEVSRQVNLNQKRSIEERFMDALEPMKC